MGESINSRDLNFKLKRVQWIDFAKGIAIFLVVLGHAVEATFVGNPDSNIVHIAIYSFHMPFFFMLSGMLFSEVKYSSWKRFVSKKFLTLIVPSYIFAIIMLIREIVENGGIYFSSVEIFRMLLQFRVDTPANYWFLPTLFFSFIIMWVIHKIFQGNIERMLCSIVVSFMGVIYICVIAKPLPFSFDNAVLVVVFMELGYQLKDRIKELNGKGAIVYTCLGVMWIVSTYVNYTYFGKKSISLAYVTILNPVLFFISAISASVLILLLCSKVNKKTKINFWGEHTLVIYLLGGMILGYILRVFRQFQIKDNRINLLICLVVSAITVELAAIISILIKRYCPFILGEKRKKE